jgi:AraC-like DNA-binding protein
MRKSRDNREKKVNDFACAAMIRLLKRGMEKLGLTPPVADPRGGPIVELDFKRALVAHVLRERGPGALVQLGQAVHDMGVDPILSMLVRVGSPRQVMSRFQRLERFVHSRHRMVVEDNADTSMRMRHVSLVEGEPPLPAEDLVVLGVLIGFLQVAGCKGVSAHFDHGCIGFPDTGVVDAAFQTGYTDRWTIEWKSFAPAAESLREPELGLDSSPPVVRKIAHYCATDADTTLPAVAAKLNMSKRTLQRRLREAGYDFRAITGDVRNRVAAWWLTETDRSIAEIGFLCGYSDQAHFTRDFRHRNGPTPNAYRER